MKKDIDVTNKHSKYIRSTQKKQMSFYAYILF